MRYPNALHTHFAKTYVQNELKGLESDDLLYDTYMEAMPASKIDGLGREDILVEARILYKRCSKLVQRYRASFQDISYYNQASVIDELDEAIDMARGQENPNVMITGVMNKAKVLGMVTHKVETNHSGTINIEQEAKGISSDFISRLADAGIRIELEDKRDVIDVEADK